MRIKTRFAPSPTGKMHLGNARTALFSALYAASQNGIFLLRIEDTDIVRSEERFTQVIYQDLTWLGLHWQEGSDQDQGNGPYFQSQRSAIYEKYYQLLLEKNLAYPCFCSDDELAISRKVQLSSGKAPRYSGPCAELTSEAYRAKLAQGLKPTLRFHVPKGISIKFLDFVKGEMDFNTDDFGDFIIRRADGTPSFMFCNAIDDALMGVTHVIRGDDHLTNTPRQLLILQMLGLPVPEYGHVSMIFGYDGLPLSKRHGSSSLEDLKEAGYLSQAVMNYLARSGHHYADNHLMSFDELAKNFKLESLSASPAKFDSVQLDFWQKLAIHSLSVEALWAWMGDVVHQNIPDDRRDIFIETVRSNIVSPDQALSWAAIFFKDGLVFDEEKTAILKKAGHVFFDCAVKALHAHGNQATLIMDALKKELNVKGKDLFMPLRVALTGEMHGPELVKIFEILGAEKVEARLEKGLRETENEIFSGNNAC